MKYLNIGNIIDKLKEMFDDFLGELSKKPQLKPIPVYSKNNRNNRS